MFDSWADAEADEYTPLSPWAQEDSEDSGHGLSLCIDSGLSGFYWQLAAQPDVQLPDELLDGSEIRDGWVWPEPGEQPQEQPGSEQPGSALLEDCTQGHPWQSDESPTEPEPGTTAHSGWAPYPGHFDNETDLVLRQVREPAAFEMDAAAPGEAALFTAHSMDAADAIAWQEAPELAQLEHEAVTLAVGHRGAAVAEVQQWFGLEADGLFTPALEHLVAEFQQSHGLIQQDGVQPGQIDGPTLARLRQVFSGEAEHQEELEEEQSPGEPAELDSPASSSIATDPASAHFDLEVREVQSYGLSSFRIEDAAASLDLPFACDPLVPSGAGVLFGGAQAEESSAWLETLRTEVSDGLQAVVDQAPEWMTEFWEQATESASDLQAGVVEFLRGFNEFQTGVGYGYLTSNFVPADEGFEQEHDNWLFAGGKLLGEAGALLQGVYEFLDGGGTAAGGVAIATGGAVISDGLGAGPAIALGGAVTAAGLAEMGHDGMVAQRAGENLRDDLLRAIDGGGGSDGVPVNRDGPLWEELQLEPKVRKRLEYEQVAPKTVRELAERGMSAEELAEFVQSFQREYPHSGVADGGQLAEMLNDLGKYGQTAREAKELLQATAKRGQKGFKEVERMLEMMNELETSGRLNNPQGLKNILEDATPGLRRNSRSGHIRELEIALERVRQGHDVQLGVVYDYRLGRDVGGDVVDFTAREVIQSKDLTTKSEETFFENINKAAAQSMGRYGEFPPLDSRGREFKKIIEIRLDVMESSELNKLNGRILLGKLSERIQLHGQLYGFSGLLRIRIGENIMEFQIRAGSPGVVQLLS